jgi:hypothetical protein
MDVNKYSSICIFTYIYIYIYLHIYVNRYQYIYTYMCIYLQTHTYMHLTPCGRTRGARAWRRCPKGTCNISRFGVRVSTFVGFRAFEFPSFCGRLSSFIFSGVWVRFSGFRYRVLGIGYQVSGIGFQISGFIFRDLGL